MDHEKISVVNGREVGGERAKGGRDQMGPGPLVLCPYGMATQVHHQESTPMDLFLLFPSMFLDTTLG